MSVEVARRRLHAVYKAHQPSRLEQISDLLAKWAGREAEIVAKVESKYLHPSVAAPSFRAAIRLPISTSVKGQVGVARSSGAGLSLRESKENWEGRGRELRRGQQMQAQAKVKMLHLSIHVQ